MKYLVTCDRLFADAPGGAYRIAWELAVLAERTGHEVAVLCGTPDPMAAGVAVVSGITVLRYHIPQLMSVDPRRWHVHVNAAAHALSDQLGVHWDVVHVHTLVGGAATAKAGVNGSYVYTVHSPAVLEQQVNWTDGTFSGILKRTVGMPLLRRAEAMLLRRAKTIHVLSDFTKRELGRLYGPDVFAKSTVIPWWQSPVEHPSRNDARARLGLPREGCLLLSVRRLVRRMGLDILIEALRPLSDGPDWRLLIGGEGPERTSLESLTRRYGLMDRVSFAGRMSDEEVSLAYRACDAFVLPTRALECFGIIVLEALGHGRPVLASRVDAIPEILEAITPEWLFEREDVVGLTRKLRSVVARQLPVPNERDLQKFISTRFDRSRLEEAYTRLIEGPCR